MATPRPLLADDDTQRQADVAWLVERYQRHLRSTRSRKTGMTRSDNTLKGYAYELDFALDFLRYRPGDPRLAIDGIEVGDPMLLTNPEQGVSTRDLLAFLDHRERSNRQTRMSNEHAMARWAKAVTREERRAEREGRKPELPDPPTLTAEIAEPRTVQSAGKLLKAMFIAAHDREWIDYQPWTETVDDHLIKPAPTTYTRKSVLRRDQVDRIAHAIGEATRDAVVDGTWTSVDGQRYRTAVLLAGYLAPRPEELTAIRRSWLELDRARPRIALHNAEVDGSKVPLKHRREGEVRYLYLDEEPELLAELKRHVDRYVTQPHPDADDADHRDPYVFTTHADARLDLSHFRRR